MKDFFFIQKKDSLFEHSDIGYSSSGILKSGLTLMQRIFEIPSDKHYQRDSAVISQRRLTENYHHREF